MNYLGIVLVSVICSWNDFLFTLLYSIKVENLTDLATVSIFFWTGYLMIFLLQKRILKLISLSKIGIYQTISIVLLSFLSFSAIEIDLSVSVCFLRFLCGLLAGFISINLYPLLIKYNINFGNYRYRITSFVFLSLLYLASAKSGSYFIYLFSFLQFLILRFIDKDFADYPNQPESERIDLLSFLKPSLYYVPIGIIFLHLPYVVITKELGNLFVGGFLIIFCTLCVSLVPNLFMVIFLPNKMTNVGFVILSLCACFFKLSEIKDLVVLAIVVFGLIWHMFNIGRIRCISGRELQCNNVVFNPVMGIGFLISGTLYVSYASFFGIESMMYCLIITSIAIFSFIYFIENKRKK